jgi:hypothetical protein
LLTPAAWLSWRYRLLFEVAAYLRPWRRAPPEPAFAHVVLIIFAHR